MRRSIKVLLTLTNIRVSKCYYFCMNNITKKSGFTLIELLVVIAIIGILSVVLYASFTEARQESRNKAFQSEMKETQLAIELYKAQNGVYPSAYSVCATTAAGVVTARASDCGSNPPIDGLIPDFISVLPDRNKSANSNCDLVYETSSTGDWYKLTAEYCHGGATEASEGIQSDNKFARCPSEPVCTASGVCDPASIEFYESYAVYSAGGECE